MKQQTAIDWFKSEIDSMQNIYMDLAKKNKSLKKEVDGILTATTILRMKCKQAKEMEKEQITNAFNYGLHNKWGSESQVNDGEQYYNETYNQK